MSVNWSELPARNQWSARSIGWWEGGNASAIACNQNNISSALCQSGGCILMSTEKLKDTSLRWGKKDLVWADGLGLGIVGNNM